MRLFPNKIHQSSIRILLLSVLLSQGLTAQQKGADSAIAEKELERRHLLLQKGQNLLKEGDEFYRSAEYGKAATAYGTALDSVPASPISKELRLSLAQRYSQSSIEFAKELSRNGDLTEAETAIDRALKVKELSDDPELMASKTDLMDPIRTNPALTSEHAGEVDNVRRLLYLAQGAYDLGKFDESKRHYEDVLRIDATNSAARRGMERVAAQKSGYFKSAYDQHRAKALSDVSAEWELPRNPGDVIPEFELLEGGGNPSSFIPVANKLERIIIPKFFLEGATLMEAIELLRVRAAENDDLAVDPTQKGFNIAVDLGDPSVPETQAILAKTFDLNLSNLPAEAILKYITRITGTTFRTDEYAVRISRMGGSGQEMVRETYRVPPDFLSNLSAGAEQAAENEDIFNSEPGNAGLLAQRMGVQEALVQQGISFPNGASAFLNPATNTLRVVNTEMNQDIIRQIIDSIVQTEPVSVAVRVTILKVQKSVLEELSFDWLLNPFNFGPESSGGRVLNLAGGTVGSGNPQGTLPSGGGLPTVSNPITSGNRSGEWATVPSSVESLLRSGATRDTQEFDRAPGIIGMNGIVGNSQIQMLMRGLNQKGNFDMMAQPSVTTRSGQSASINISQEFIYPTEYDPPEVPSSVGGDAVSPVTPASPTEFDTRDVGVQLEVLPVADANRQFIDITLNPTITDFDGFVNYGSPILAPSSEGTSLVLTENTILMPVFSVKRVNTNLTVADGSTMVIGGLLKDELTNLNDKTPLLGDIPVVGRLFQSNVTRQTSTAILFLVNVELLDPTGRPFRNR